MLDWHGLDSLWAATLLAPCGFSPGVLASLSRTVEQLDEAALTSVRLPGRSRAKMFCWVVETSADAPFTAALRAGDLLT